MAKLNQTPEVVPETEVVMVPTYTFNGMSPAESKTWLAAMRKNIELPRGKKYKRQPTDKGAMLQAKLDRQKKFREDREAELQEKLKQHQKYRSLGEVTFKRGETVALDAMVNDDKRPVELSLKEVSKLNGLCEVGVFTRGEAKASAPRKAPKPTIPTVEECIETGYDEEEAEFLIADAKASLEEWELAQKAAKK